MTSVWVRLHGFPYDLWSWDEFSRIFSPYGAVVLELDAGTRFRYDYRFARVRIGIGDASALPAQHNLTHRSPTSFVSTSNIDFEVETAETESIHVWRGRLNGRPFPNGTPFGTAPPQVTAPPEQPAPAEQPQAKMEVDPPLNNNHVTSSTATRPYVSESAPPVQRSLYSSSPAHTPSLRSPIAPRRRGGVTIIEPPPLQAPLVGASPSVGKGKQTLQGCKSDIPDIADYDSDDSDEESFQRALNAIHNGGREVGSSSGITPTSSDPPPQSNKIHILAVLYMIPTTSPCQPCSSPITFFHHQLPPIGIPIPLTQRVSSSPILWRNSMMKNHFSLELIGCRPKRNTR